MWQVGGEKEACLTSGGLMDANAMNFVLVE